jgi:3-oxoadipate enol-lactonase
MMDRVRNMIRSTSSFGYIGCAQAILGLDYLSRLKAITLPVIFIVGAQDGGTPPEAAQAMHKEVAGSQYVEIDPAAHVSNMENPVAFNKTLDDFLSGLNK